MYIILLNQSIKLVVVKKVVHVDYMECPCGMRL